MPGALKTPPPWPANSEQLQLRLRAIGLPALTAEGRVVHIHQHLDLYVDGKQVEVPGDIGIGPGGTFLSDLHTHASYPPGIIHVEASTPSSFSLGQFFAVWGVPLSATCIGSLCEKGSKQLRTWVNGKPLKADPTRIVLAAAPGDRDRLRDGGAGAQAGAFELRLARGLASRSRRSRARRGAP